MMSIVTTLLDEMGGQIDAVVVATPDHTHAVAAIAAMRRGKPVFCEKPLSRTVREARLMRETARQQKVVTQMGNQGSASNGLRRAVEFVADGTIGEIREAHLWFAGGNGPQTRPTDNLAVPASLDWDLWLGPAPERPYNPCYVPGKWRNWSRATATTFPTRSGNWSSAPGTWKRKSSRSRPGWPVDRAPICSARRYR